MSLTNLAICLACLLLVFGNGLYGQKLVFDDKVTTINEPVNGWVTNRESASILLYYRDSIDLFQFDPMTGKMNSRISILEQDKFSNIDDISISTDGRFVAIINGGGKNVVTVRADWSEREFKIIDEFDVHKLKNGESFLQTRFSDDGKYLYAVGTNIHVFSLENGRLKSATKLELGNDESKTEKISLCSTQEIAVLLDKNRRVLSFWQLNGQSEPKLIGDLSLNKVQYHVCRFCDSYVASDKNNFYYACLSGDSAHSIIGCASFRDVGDGKFEFVQRLGESKGELPAGSESGRAMAISPDQKFVALTSEGSVNCLLYARNIKDGKLKLVDTIKRESFGRVWMVEFDNESEFLFLGGPKNEIRRYRIKR